MKQIIISYLNLFFYTNIISYIVKFIWLNALTSGSMKSKNLSVLLTPFIEDGYNRLDIRLIVSVYNICSKSNWTLAMSQVSKTTRAKPQVKKKYKIKNQIIKLKINKNIQLLSYSKFQIHFCKR